MVGILSRVMHVHHSAQYMEADGLTEAREAVRAVAHAYEATRGAAAPPDALGLLERLKAAPAS